MNAEVCVPLPLAVSDLVSSTSPDTQCSVAASA